MNAIPTKPFQIRRAYSSEYALLGRMTADVYAKLDGMPDRVEQPGYYAKLLDVAQRARVPTCEILVAMSPDNALLGGVTFVGDMKYYGSGGTAGTLKASSGLRFLAVKPEARRHGVGRALTHECIQRAICRRSTRNRAAHHPCNAYCMEIVRKHGVYQEGRSGFPTGKSHRIRFFSRPSEQELAMRTKQSIGYFAFLARANKESNKKLMAILNKNSMAFDYPINGYFKSIHMVVDHTYVADNYWLADISYSLGITDKLGINLCKLPGYDSFSFLDYNEFSEKRVKMDDKLISLTEYLDREKLEKGIKQFGKPEDDTGPQVWKGLLHLFNHQAHHRGQISSVLDRLGIDNDYSTICTMA